MTTLSDPTTTLSGEDREAFERAASARAHAEGRSELGQVYVAMFNNARLAARVSALGEQLRFAGTLPDEIRELVILRFAARRRYGYEWSHHQRPARLAGIPVTVIDAVARGDVPADLPDASRAALEAVDAVAAGEALPIDVQERFIEWHGEAGMVELVVLCGHYSIMGYMVTAFDIELEKGLPEPPF